METKFEVFIKKIKEEVEKLCREGFIIKKMEMPKNNGLERKGLGIIEEGSSIMSIIYMEEYFNRHIHGEAMDGLAYDIYEAYKAQKALEGTIPGTEDIRDFGSLGQKVIYHLVNAEMNAKHLSHVPHIPLTDLAVIFYVYFGDYEDGQIFSIITNRLMGVWRISLKDLLPLAAENTQRLFPATLDNMGEYLAEIIAEGGLPEDTIKFSPENMPSLYILTNDYRRNGAATILYPGMLKNIAKELGDDLLIIPSSVHEVILMPYHDAERIDMIEKMIVEVNREQVPQPEQLSDHAYIYRRRCNQLRLALNGEETMPGFPLDQLCPGK